MRIWIPLCLFVLLAGTGVSAATINPSLDFDPKFTTGINTLVIPFQSNKINLDKDAKTKIHKALEGYFPTPGEIILVVGYTDNLGDPQQNNRLSLKRAKAVQAEIVEAMGYPPHSILVIGKGEENPLGNNGDADGRAKNRRVEIYFAQMINGVAAQWAPSRKPPKSATEILIDEARMHVRRRQLTPAVQTLSKAKALGGDQLSSWHTVYGIAGFYAGLDANTVLTHLRRALDLDAHNMEARAFLGRQTAHCRVAAGEITRSMGRSMDTAIKIDHPEEAYEYLRLFDIQPKKREQYPDRQCEAWTGTDPNSQRVIYYFDHSQSMGWAFEAYSHRNHLKSPLPQLSASSGTARSRPLTVKPAESSPAEETRPPQNLMNSIWKSEIFR